MKKLYLDDAATSRVVPKVLKAMEPFFLEEYGNPGSLHEMGERAEKAMNEARAKLASEINAKSHEIIFTSGATESNNIALKSLWRPGKKRIIISGIEHPSIEETANFLEKAGVEVVEVPVDKDGKIKPESLEKAITKDTLLVSIIHANNIFGVVQDLEVIGKICKKHSVLFHTDATQSFGKVEIDVRKMNVSMLSASAHKIGGPKGTGLLFVKENLKVEPMMHGGGQERDLRSGTENVPGIVGFAVALDMIKKINKNKIKALRDRLVKGLEKIGGKINSPEDGLFNIVNVGFPGIDAESLVYRLSAKGIYISAGSACDSKKSKEDRVLKAIGLNDKEIKGSVRISLSDEISEEDVDRVVREIEKSVKKFRV